MTFIGTPVPQNCHKEGPNGIGNCQEDFICCEYQGGNKWQETNCHCLNGMVYDEVQIFSESHHITYLTHCQLGV